MNYYKFINVLFYFLNNFDEVYTENKVLDSDFTFETGLFFGRLEK